LIRTTARRRTLTSVLAAAALAAGAVAFASPAAAEPEPAGTVAISGTPKVGEVLTAVTSGWPEDTEFAYQWYFSGGQYGGPIDGAEDATYTVTPERVGEWIGVSVTTSLDGYEEPVQVLLEDVAFADKKPAAPAPVADSSQLAGYLAGVSTIDHAPGEVGLPGTIDPTTSPTANIMWGAGDSFVDVYVYSAPVFLGTFPVVGGVVQVPMSSSVLTSLAVGGHTLVAIGQTSGTVHTVAFQRAATLAATGADDTLPLTLVGGGLLLAGVALVLYRRRALGA
jgi:LPXTG-motif cell wall-anchored protein